MTGRDMTGPHMAGQDGTAMAERGRDMTGPDMAGPGSMGPDMGGADMGGLVYWSSASGNTARFVARLGGRVCRIGDDAPPCGPYVLVTPTYADGAGRGAVPKPVIRFLNDPANRALIRGVIAGGNRNFGEFFARAGDVIAGKCGVPLLYRFELAGTAEDVARVRSGLDRFWTRQPSPAR